MTFQLGDYIDVAERISEFRAKHPEGSLQPAIVERPYTIESVGEATFIVYVAAAYRTPDDKLPGIGAAWEPFPGKTTFTRGSELQNAETSAWGRAIVAALAGDTKRAVASTQEVASRAEEAEKDKELEEAKSRVWELAKKAGWSVTDLGGHYVQHTQGKAISNATAAELHAYANKLEAEAA